MNSRGVLCSSKRKNDLIRSYWYFLQFEMDNAYLIRFLIANPRFTGAELPWNTEPGPYTGSF